MWGVFDFDVFGFGNGLVELVGGGVDWKDVVFCVVEDECGFVGGVDGFDIFVEIFDLGGDDCIGGDRGVVDGYVLVVGDGFLVDVGFEVFVEVVEVVVELCELGEVVVFGCSFDFVEDILWYVFGVVVVLYEEWFE